MDVDRLGVHESVSTVFPPAELVEDLDDVDCDVAVVDDDGLVSCDAAVTFGHHAGLLQTDWAHSIQAGYDAFPLDAFESAGVALTTSAGIHDDSVGETVAGYMLMLARGLHRYARSQDGHEWQPLDWDDAFTLTDESVCVVGLGTLGRGIVERANALGMTVTGVKRTPEPVRGVETVYGPEDLHDAISGVRFVVLAVPLTDATQGLIGTAELETMAADAYLVNVARGEVVDQSSLVDALTEGAIAGAALDVFEEEPLPEESPLWDFENVVVTPHRAALTVDYYRDVAALVRENVARIEANETLVNRVV